VFRERPPALVDAEPRWRAALGDRLLVWGRLESRDAYLDLLGRAQICLSTAIHEFFGISVLEAAHWGARPLVPDALSYPELFDASLRYANTEDHADAIAQLEALCRAWSAGVLDLRGPDWAAASEPFAAARMLPRYRALCEQLLATSRSARSP
jgi:hypothetical protein